MLCYNYFIRLSDVHSFLIVIDSVGSLKGYKFLSFKACSIYFKCHFCSAICL